MAITRTAVIDDDGTGTTGTVFEDAWKQELYDQIDDALADTAADAAAAAIAAAAAVTDATLPFSDITTNNVSTAKHGFTPKLPNDATKFLNGAGAWAVPSGAVTTTITSTSTGAQNNWAPAGMSGNTLVEWSGASDLAATGLAGGAAGQFWTLRNTGTKVATFAHNSGSSSAANRFKNCATSAATPVAPGGFITYQHDGTDWQLVDHDQGAFITPAYAAGDFTASGSMTWTVDSGDISTYAYKLDGRRLSVLFAIISTSVGGTLSNNLRIKVPGGFTNTKFVLSVSLNYVDAGSGGNTAGFVRITVGGTNIECYKFNVGNWTSATNNTETYGEIFFEVD
jgi:hypothetical protein